ncbi:MAG: NADH-quinone oxidoreductase subunit M, partial [Bacteroidota bacterium]
MDLNLLIIVPLLTSLVLLFCNGLNQLRTAAFIGSVAQLGLAIWLFIAYTTERTAGNTAPMLFTSGAMWFEHWNIKFLTGVDGISVAMILLTAFVVVAGVLISWKEDRLSKEFFFLLMLLSVGAYGFFISLDLFTLFFFLEVAVIPKFL